MRLQQFLIPFCLAVAAARLQASPNPGAVRVAVDGQIRVVRTLGQPADADFYAPLVKPLRSLWLDVQPSGSDEVEIRYQGSRVARWPVVTNPDQLPPDFNRPTVLRQGDEILVPVRALVTLGNGRVDWDDHSRTLTITPTVRRLDLKQGERGLEVRMEASAPVRVTSLQLAHPPRLVIDITPAWFRVDDTPKPTGLIRSVRLGQFTRDTARVVMELSGGPVRVAGLPQAGTTITARLQPGSDVRIAYAEQPSSTLATSERSATAGPAESPAITGTRSAPVPTPHAAAPRTRGRRLSVQLHRGLASRGGFVRRDPRSILEDGAAGPLAGKVICIDPGHGGWKSGASGLNGLKEGDACLAMAQQLARALRESGATVIMPREDDRYVSLEDRYNFANLKAADIFISIHCNAMQRHNTMSGSETYYWSPQSMELARAIHPEVVRVMAGRDGGIRRRAFAVIHHTTMPSILIEVGYIDNVNDEAKLGDPGFQEEFGNSVRDGVVRYFTGG